MLTEEKHNPLIKEVGRQTYELLKFQHFRVLWVENTGTPEKQVEKILGNPHLLKFLIILDAISLEKRNNYIYLWITRKKEDGGGGGGKDTLMIWLPFQISPALCHDKSCILLLSWGLCCTIPWWLCFGAPFALNLGSSLSSCNNTGSISSLFSSKAWSKPILSGRRYWGSAALGSCDSLSLTASWQLLIWAEWTCVSLLARFVMCFWFPAAEMHFG